MASRTYVSELLQVPAVVLSGEVTGKVSGRDVGDMLSVDADNLDWISKARVNMAN